MKLKRYGDADGTGLPQHIKRRNSRLTFWVAGILLSLYTFIVFFAGLVSADHQLLDSRSVISSISHLPTLTKNRLAGLRANPDHLYIEIKHKHFQKLAYKREVALLMGRLVANDDDYVPAVIKKNNTSYQAKLRLKGDWLDHLEGDKWSYRVKIKNDDALDGLRVFSIQHPKTRNYLAEWLYHEALRREDIIALRYEFVRVSVNGKNLGIFALEEHFNKILIENNQLREGPIIRLSEDVIWDQLNNLTSFPQTVPYSSGAFHAAPLDAFESKSLSADSTQRRLFLKAISLFEAFRNGEKTTREVFDITKLSTFLALSELLGAQHGTIWNNMRFYFNPITARLEPIGFDGQAGAHLLVTAASMKDEQLLESRLDLFILALKDPLFEKAYLEALNRVSNPAYLNAMLDALAPRLEEKQRIIYQEFPDYSFPYTIFEQNRKLIDFTLHPVEGVRVHIKKHTADSLFFEIGSTQALPVELRNLVIGDAARQAFQRGIKVPGRHRDEGIVYRDLSIAIPDSFIVTDSSLALLQVEYAIQGTDSSRKVAAIPYPHDKKSYLRNALTSQPANVDEFPFLLQDDVRKEINVKEGTWVVEKNLILPEGYLFRAEGDITLDLSNDAVILTKGPVSFQGSSTGRITITSTDSTGQGFVVLNAGRKSIVSNTTFNNLHSVNQHGWSLPGSVTFYESEVEMDDVQFNHASSEDALNIVRTSFQLNKVQFHNNASDAFDADFTKGAITNAVFHDSGNDGIDVSGSQLTLENIEIKNAGDKAFSAGEFSQIDGHGLDISQSEIALASKDQSTVELSNVTITDTRVGAVIFQKKPEFGAASLKCDDLTMKGVDIKALIEEGSLFFMNGESLPANQQHVSELLYGNLYGTTSK